MSRSSTALVTPSAIRGRRLRRTPGSLVARHGLIEFRTSGGPVFRAPLAEGERVAWPWWWSGTRLVITVCGETYRITFTPADDEGRSDTDSSSTADTDVDLLVAVIELCLALGRLGGRSGERSAARRWRELLPPTAA